MAYRKFAKMDEHMQSMLDDLGIMDDFKEGLEDIEKLLSSHSSKDYMAFIPMDFPDELLTTIGRSSDTNSSSHVEFLKEQRKAFRLAKKNRKFYICDRCGKRFLQKEKIVSHMLQIHLQQEKPVAMAGYTPWYRGIQTGDSNINRSNQVWRMRKEQDGKN